MKLLFLTIGDFPSIRHHEIYPDLLREFLIKGHEVYVISARERKKNLPTELIEEDGAKLLKLRIGNITKTNLVEKGISTILVESQYKMAIRKYFSNVKFDMVMYSTPPVTLAGVVNYVKKRDHAKAYLLLKDIFPQNAVDIGMMSTSGVKGLLYRFFRAKEKKLYAVSDRIGCMSQANVDYVIKHNPEIAPTVVEICPNAIDVQDMSITAEERKTIRTKYNIPLDRKVFVYGGNLGKPQGIPFIIDCLKLQDKDSNAYFLIVGDGTEYGKLEQYIEESKPQNVKLMRRLPKEDYDRMVAACDVGLIFLDHRFTIPNFPSRLLAYMQAGIPVLACTDHNTDIGKIIVEGNFGWWCESNNEKGFCEIVKQALAADTAQMGECGYRYLEQHYSVSDACRTILSRIES